MKISQLLILVAMAIISSVGLASAQDNLLVVLPGQTFTSGSGFSGNVSLQTVGASFAIKLYALSGGDTVDTTFSVTTNVSYNGPTGGASYTTTVIFTNGVSKTSVATILTNAQTTTITANINGLNPEGSFPLQVNPKLVVTLPGQTFTSGQVTNNGNSGAVSIQAAGTPFNLTLTTINADNTIDTGFTGGQVVTYIGPARSPNGTAPSYTTNVTFSSGQATTLATILYDAQTAAITANATNGGVGSAVGLASSSVTVTNTGAATTLVFSTQTGGGQPGLVWNVQPVVTIGDFYGNVMTNVAQNVTLAIEYNSGGGTLSGTTTVAVNTLTGAATFSGLSINDVGAYTLTATGNTVDTTAGTVVGDQFIIRTLTAYDHVIFNDQPYAYWPLQDAAGPIITDAAGTNDGTLMTSTDTGLGKDLHAAFTNASGASDGISYTLGGPGFLLGVTNDTAIYFTNLNGQPACAQIVVPYNPQMDPKSNFTAEAWVRLPTYPIGYSTTNANYQAMLGFEANSGSQSGWYFDAHTDGQGASAGIIDVNLAHSSQKGFTASGPIPEAFTNNLQGTWVHTVITYDGSVFRYYENGTLLYFVNNPTYGPVSGLPSHIEPFIIGSYCESYFNPDSSTGGGTGNTRGNFFDGGISHVAFYTNVLTPAQILDHYLTATSTNVLPLIPVPPAGGTNYIGYSRTFSVTAGGAPPLFYQWYFGASPILGATNDTLTLTNLQLTNSGNYTVTVTNILGSTNSPPATLLVLSLPSDTYQSNIISALPMGFYPLHETNGTVAADLIDPVDNNGIYVTYDTNTPVLLNQPGPSVYLGSAVTMNSAVSNGIVIPKLTAMSIVGPLTLEAWVQFQDIVDEQWVVAHSPNVPSNPNGSADILGIYSNMDYYVDRYVETATPPDFDASYPVPPGDLGKWVYLVGVADGTYWHLYENGSEIASILDTNIPSGAIGANGEWSIGGRSANSSPPEILSQPLDGSVDNVAIYNYALTPAQVLQHYQLGVYGIYASVSIQPSGSNVIISWSGYLQQAGSLFGPWTYANTNTVTSPYTVPSTNAAAFYRATVISP